MSESVLTHGAPARSRECTPAERVTKSLLGYGVICGPFYVVVALIQALLRPGFNISRDDVSLLSNGSFGWVQIANFVVTGLMVVCCAVGAWRALGSGRGATWGPLLLGVFGLGLIAAGVFVADPMNGFPAGAPAGRPTSVSVHGMLHIVSAGIGFAALIASCFVFASRLARDGKGNLALLSRVTGVAFLAGFVGVASGSSSTLVVAAFWIALLVVWGWLASLAVHLYRQVASAEAAPGRPA